MAEKRPTGSHDNNPIQGLTAPNIDGELLTAQESADLCGMSYGGWAYAVDVGNAPQPVKVKAAEVRVRYGKEYTSDRTQRYWRLRDVEAFRDSRAKRAKKKEKQGDEALLDYVKLPISHYRSGNAKKT